MIIIMIIIIIIWQEFASCIVNTDPSKYASPDPNIVHFLAACEWQHLYIAEMAGLCDNMPTEQLKKIALDHGMLEGRGKTRVGGCDWNPSWVFDMLCNIFQKSNICLPCEAFRIVSYVAAGVVWLGLSRLCS